MMAPIQDLGNVENCGSLITTPSMDFPTMEMRCPSDLWQADGLASYPRLPKMDVPPTEPTSGVAEKTEDSKPSTLPSYYLFTIP